MCSVRVRRYVEVLRAHLFARVDVVVHAADEHARVSRRRRRGDTEPWGVGTCELRRSGAREREEASARRV
jgi:hypothetical protein